MKDNPTVLRVQIDGWSKYHHGYIGIIITYLTAEWKRATLALAHLPYDDHHTAPNLAELLKTSLDKWNLLGKFQFLTSDSAANMMAMGPHLGDVEHVKCLNHVLQLVINDEVFKGEQAKKTIETIRRFTNYVSNSVLLDGECRKIAENIGVQYKAFSQDVPTRWNSTFDMLQSFIKNEPIVRKIAEDNYWKAKAKINLSNCEWDYVKALCDVLGPFKETTMMLQRDEATLSQYIPTIKIIEDKLTETSTRPQEPVMESVAGSSWSPANGAGLGMGKKIAAKFSTKGLKRRLLENLLSRVGDLEEEEAYQLSSLLDPRYKQWCFKEEKQEEAIKNLKRAVSNWSQSEADEENNQECDQEQASSSDSSSASNIFQKLRSESLGKRPDSRPGAGSLDEVVDNYLKADLLTSTKILSFWREYEATAGENRYKIALARLARFYLTPPPTSTCVERLFSQAGNFLTDTRNALLPETLQRMMFLRSNMVAANFEMEY